MILVVFFLAMVPAAPALSDPQPAVDPYEDLVQTIERVGEIDKADADLRSKIQLTRVAFLEATAEANEAAEQVESLKAEIAAIESRLRERAVDAYTGVFGDLDAGILDEEPTEALNRKLLLDLVQSSDDELAARLEDARRELVAERSAAEARAERAKDLEVAMLDQLDDLAALRDEMERQAKVLAAAVKADRPEGTTLVGGDLCDASGITVACEIADDVNRMIVAARSDGVELTGSGYRDPARQIELRKAHCGSSYAAIYQMSPSACRPPTARPGTSMHEVGLAIDFRNCSSRSTACYRWLSANAASFGLRNLPSEPWHWSTTGS